MKEPEHKYKIRTLHNGDMTVTYESGLLCRWFKEEDEIVTAHNAPAYVVYEAEEILKEAIREKKGTKPI